MEKSKLHKSWIKHSENKEVVLNFMSGSYQTEHQRLMTEEQFNEAVKDILEVVLIETIKKLK